MCNRLFLDKMGFFMSLMVLMSLMASEAANSQGHESVSPSVTYWHEKLPMTAIPDTLRELISAEDEKVAVSVGKGGVNVGVGKPPTKAGKPAPKPQPKPAPKGKGVGVSVKPPVKGKGGGGVSVGTPGKGVGVHVGTKSPYDYNYAADAQMVADPSLSMFLLEKDLHSGTKVSLQLMQRSILNSEKAYFIPRRVADEIPFSSDKLSVAMEELDIAQGSDTAVAMKETLQDCESPAIKGESKYCATSLESMIDYTTSKLGTNHVNVLVTEVPKSSKSVKQQYSITGIRHESKSGGKSVVCHKERYAYAVYLCHESKDTKTVQVSLRGEDGSGAEAVAVCHADTSAWNPKHVAFQVLNVKPGGAAVCHFIPQDHIVWLPAK